MLSFQPSSHTDLDTWAGQVSQWRNEEGIYGQVPDGEKGEL